MVAEISLFFLLVAIAGWMLMKMVAKGELYVQASLLPLFPDPVPVEPRSPGRLRSGGRTSGRNSGPGFPDVQHCCGHRGGADLRHDRPEGGSRRRRRVPGVQADSACHALILRRSALLLAGFTSLGVFAAPPSIYKNLGPCIVPLEGYGVVTTAFENYFANGGVLQVPVHARTGGSMTVYCVQMTDDWTSVTTGEFDACQDFTLNGAKPVNGIGTYGYTISFDDSSNGGKFRINGIVPPQYADNMYDSYSGIAAGHWYSDPNRDWEYTWRPYNMAMIGPKIAWAETTYTQHLSGTCNKVELTKDGFPNNISYMQNVKPIHADTCSQIPDCKTCSWPYASIRAGCACLLDQSKLQPLADLRRTCYAWAQTAGSLSQFFFDESRSNFNKDAGAIRCAASSPSEGRTIYMPAGKCPANTAVVSRADSSLFDPDSSGDDISGSVDDRPIKVEGLGNDSGGSPGGTGEYDSMILDRLDSILYGGKSASDSVDSILGRQLNSLDSAVESVQGGLDSLAALGTFHGSRYDTNSVVGVSLDSLLNICWTFDEERKCISDTEYYSDLITWFKWIRRFYLILWGFICAWIFFKLATYKAD